LPLFQVSPLQKPAKVSIAAADFVPADEACGNDEEELVMKRWEQAVGTLTKKIGNQMDQKESQCFRVTVTSS